MNAPAPIPHSIEAEQALLGAIMINPDALGMVSGTISEADFFEPVHRDIFRLMQGEITAGRRVTPVTLKTAMPDVTIAGLPLSQYLARIAAEATTVINAPDYATHLRDLASIREIIMIGEDLRRAGNELTSPTAALQAAWEKVDALRGAIADQMTQRSTIGAIMGRLLEADDALVIPTRLTDLDRMIGGGLRAGRLAIVGGRPSMGKAQPLFAKVLAVDGWKLMRDIQVGDTLVHPEGGTTKVTGIFPQGVKPIYRTTFSDGRSTHCCDEHLWQVADRHWTSERVVPLSMVRLRQETFRLSIPLRPSDSGEAELPIPPYAMGVLLGDGFFHPNGVLFSSADRELVGRMAGLVPAPLAVAFHGGYDYRITARKGIGNAWLRQIRILGLGHCRSATKFIPEIYKTASFAQRLDLLRGLLDTDGTVESCKTVRFSSGSERLADDVVYVARSIGAWAKKRERARPHYTYNGEARIGARSFIVTIRHNQPHELFHLERKRAKLGDGGKNVVRLRLAFAKIEASGEAECQCIKVDREDGLYFTDDFIVTHNTILGTCIARRVATQGYGVSFFSLETDEKEMGARLAADALSRSQGGPVVYRDIIAGQLTDGDRIRVQATAERLGKLPMRMDCSGGLSIAEIEGRARTDRDRFAKAGTPLGLVVIDYLGLVRHGDRYRGRKVDEVGEISFGAKTMAKRLGCCVMLLAQLNRGVEQRDDKIPSMSDLRDSGNIEQDADLIGLLYRPIYYTEKSAEWRDHSPEVIERADRERHRLDLIIGKNKLGPTHTVDLWCDVSLSAIDNAARY